MRNNIPDRTNLYWKEETRYFVARLTPKSAIRNYIRDLANYTKEAEIRYFVTHREAEAHNTVVSVHRIAQVY